MGDGMHYGDHVGDWRVCLLPSDLLFNTWLGLMIGLSLREHSMVRFRDEQATGIYYSQHSSGTAYDWNEEGLSLRNERVC